MKATITVHCPLNDRGTRNLENILQARGALIKKALSLPEGLPLAFSVEGEDVTFDWGIEADTAAPACALLGAICTLAAKSRWISAKEVHPENERYSFRVFLVRLGLSGPEHKEIRAALLQNLQGDSAYIHGRP